MVSPLDARSACRTNHRSLYTSGRPTRAPAAPVCGHDSNNTLITPSPFPPKPPSPDKKQNGGFEEPNTMDPNIPKAPFNTYNSKWGWYTSIPGGWGFSCLRTDWGPVRVLEIQHGAVASPAEGLQNLELLPNATGVACQTVDVTPGAKYKLSFYYGRLQTYAWRNEYAGQFVKFETTMDALARDGSKPAPNEANPNGPAPYPKDTQGFARLVTADTRKQGSQWQRYEAEVTVRYRSLFGSGGALFLGFRDWGFGFGWVGAECAGEWAGA